MARETIEIRVEPEAARASSSASEEQQIADVLPRLLRVVAEADVFPEDIGALGKQKVRHEETSRRCLGETLE